MQSMHGTGGREMEESAEQKVEQRHAKAVCFALKGTDPLVWQVWSANFPHDDSFLGQGATEAEAWQDAASRIGTKGDRD